MMKPSDLLSSVYLCLTSLAETRAEELRFKIAFRVKGLRIGAEGLTLIDEMMTR